MSNSEFVEHIMDILSRFSDIKLCRMFGGYGIYRGKIIFAIIMDLRQVVAWKGCSPLNIERTTIVTW